MILFYIEKVINDYKAALPDNAVIYVYDNNSTDGTAEIARKAGAVVRHETMQGKRNVIGRMFREIEAECYIMTDGNDTYSAEDAFSEVPYIICCMFNDCNSGSELFRRSYIVGN